MSFLHKLGRDVASSGRVYLTGGATALLFQWRATTIDLNLKANPEPARFFEVIAQLKDDLAIDVELASPDHFIPLPSGWQERSVFIGRFGKIDFFHFDLYSQALAKIERGHDRDHRDVQAMLQNGHIHAAQLEKYFAVIEPELIRFPSIRPQSFRAAVEAIIRP